MYNIKALDYICRPETDFQVDPGVKELSELIDLLFITEGDSD